MAAKKRPQLSDLLSRLAITGMGTGYLRPAPGTWGSFAVAILCLAALRAGGGNLLTVNVFLAALVLLSTAGCIALGPFTERAFGKKDPSYCTLDEWAGQGLALCLLPFGDTWSQWLLVILMAFLAFRLFDITKPPPVRQLERLPHGFGVVADDLLAGVFANILVQLVLRFILI